MELARGIEPPTCGLQIRIPGIAQTPVNMGNPLSLPGYTQVNLYPVLVSLYPL